MADDLNFNISAQYAEAAAAFTALGNDVDTFKRKLEELDRSGANPKLTAEASDLAAKLIKAQADLDKLNAKKASPKVDLDIAAEEAKLLQVTAKLDELNAKKSSPKVDADIAAAQAKMAIIEQRIRDLKDAKVNVDLDIAAAEAKIAALKAELAALGDKHVTIDVDTKDGAAKIRELSSAVDSFAGTMRTKVGLIATAILPALSSIGQLSGALGLIPAVATGAGAALATVVIGTQGMGEALKASEKATKAQEAATKADAAAQRDAATATQAGTAAGTGNIAVLKQAVAEGAAHVAQLKAQKAAGQDVTAELKAAETAQAGNVAALKTAQAAYTGNTSAAGAYTNAQKTANSSASAAAAAHRAAAKAADEQAAAMKNLAPAAQGVVSAIIQLGPAFKDLRMDVQQHLFEGMKQVLLDMANTALPVVKTGLSQMADAINQAMKNVGEFIQQQSSINAWREIFANVGTAASNLAGAVKPILQIITDVTKVGSQFLPQLAQHFKEAADRASEFISNAEKTGKLHEWIQTGIDAVKLLWGAFKDVVAIIKDLAASPGFGPDFLEALKAVTGFIRWVIETIPGATTLIQLFFEAWLFAKITSGFIGMVTKIGDVVSAIRGAITWVGEWATAHEAAKGRILAALGAVALAYGAGTGLKALGQAQPDAQSLASADPLNKARDSADTAGKLFTFDFSGAFDGFKRDIQALPQELANAGKSMQAAWTVNVQVLKNIWQTVSPFFSGLWQGIVSGAKSAATGFLGDWQGIPAKIQGAWGGISGFFSGIWQGIVSVARGAWQGFVGFLQGIPGQIQGAWGAVSGFFTSLWQGIVSVARGAWQGFVGFLQGIPGQVQSAWGAISGFFQGLWQGIVSAAQGAWQGLVGFLSGIPGQIQGAWGAVSGFFSGLWQGISSAAQTAWNAVSSAFQSALSSITSGLTGLVGKAWNVTVGIIDNATAALRGIWDWVTKLTSKVWNVIVNTVTGGAGGMIYGHRGIEMAAGGVLPMASGGTLQPNMSSSLAQIVPPNTWRVIGDRPSGDEAFIPINNSARSMSLLGETANRMGYALMPMASGGYNRRGHGRDDDDWMWERLSDLFRGGHWGGHSGGGTRAVPDPDDKTHLAFGSYVNPKTANVTSGYQTAVGAASITRSQPWHASPWTSAERGSGPPPPVIHIHPGGSGIDQMFMKWLRESIRVQGGIQLAFGS